MRLLFLLTLLTTSVLACSPSDTDESRQARHYPNAAAESYVPAPEPVMPRLVPYQGFPAEISGASCAFAPDSATLDREEYLLVYNRQSRAVVSINGKQLSLPLQKAYSQTHHRFGNDSLQVEVRYQLGEQANEAYRTTGQALLEVRGRVLDTYRVIGICQN